MFSSYLILSKIEFVQSLCTAIGKFLQDLCSPGSPITCSHVLLDFLVMMKMYKIIKDEYLKGD